MNKYLCIIGPDETYNGGMLNVIHQIMDDNIVFNGLIKIHIGTASRTNKVKVFLSGLREYIVLCKKKQVAIAHIQLSERGSLYRTMVILQISKWYGVKTIVHSHGGLFFDHFYSLGNVKRNLIRRGLNGADRVIVLTRGWEKIWCKIVDSTKIRIIPNGTIIPEIEKREYFANGNYNLLFLGNINPIKGIYDLIDAIDLLRGNINNIKLRVAGGDQISECKKYVKDKGLDKEVEVIGWVDGEEKERLFSISDVLVLPSYFESFGLVAIEAMAHRIPVVCGDRGFTKEVIIPNETGLVCKTGDAPSIAEKITELNNLDNIEAFSEKGYRYVRDNYSLEEVIKKLEMIYRELEYD